MKAHPDVVKTLQAAHDAEATTSEAMHKQENVFKHGDRKVPGLANFFDKVHNTAYRRQADLRDHLMRNGEQVQTNLGDTSYSQDPGEALKNACKHLDNLSDKYNDLHKTAIAKGDQETHERFFGVNKEIQKQYHKGEQKQQSLKDLGQDMFLHKHS